VKRLRQGEVKAVEEKRTLLDRLHSVEDLKKLKVEDLPQLAAEVRSFLIETVSQTGGHLGAGLGTVELTLALHYLLNSPHDKIIWDVSHQTYPHKILTGRKDRMHTLRQYGGLSGFTDPSESEHDHFLVAHAGTAISQGLGLACARDFHGSDEKIVVVVGDGGLTSGLAFEGLNNAGHLRKKMLIILNDNKMSIAKNVGAISHYLNKVITNPLYNRIRTEVERTLSTFPRLKKLARHALESMKHLVVPGILFEELGFRYFGPVDGHDAVGLVRTLEKVLKINDLALLHVVTEKGKGYPFAENDGERFHGVNPFDWRTGEKLPGSAEGKAGKPKRISYTEAFSRSVLNLARQEGRVVVITAAMPSGTGLLKFQQEFPDRFYDVGIAEQHAVTFAGALAKGGLKPVCAIYSTFLQRAQDQLIHDVALQGLGVTLCLDRAGLVGADGPTHNGVFDISYLGHVPGAVIASPWDEAEMEQMLKLAVEYSGIFAIRYPKAEIPRLAEDRVKPFEIGQGEVLVEGEDIAILTLGNMVEQALEGSRLLEGDGLRVAVVNMRFARPLDRELLVQLAGKYRYFFTLEDHVLTGGFGSKVLEFFERERLPEVRLRRIALPDQFTEHGTRDFLLDKYGLSGAKVRETILREIEIRDPEGVLH
jgi:1-deoxy-D-xylulose-5-phosphate synthase